MRASKGSYPAEIGKISAGSKWGAQSVSLVSMSNTIVRQTTKALRNRRRKLQFRSGLAQFRDRAGHLRVDLDFGRLGHEARQDDYRQISLIDLPFEKCARRILRSSPRQTFQSRPPVNPDAIVDHRR